MSPCYGCGIVGTHPWVAVMHTQDVEANPSGTPSAKGFVDVSVCNACHQDPAHRSAHPIKGHFFPAEARVQAVKAAGSSTLGG